MAIFQQATLTNLRNLQYGNDTIGGGNSGEPYITTAIPPANQQQVDSTNILNSDSGFIRGGFVGATRASATDFARIGKFFKDPPRGPLFIAKQIGLQLSNPQLEAPRGAGATLSNILQGNFSTLFGGGDNFNANIGTTRIYNGGINTLLQIPVNAFGGHIIRHGLLPIEADSVKYENVAKNNNEANQGRNNRLVRLKNKLEDNFNANIASYISGPDSLSGIGTTTIPRFYNALNNKQYLPTLLPLRILQNGLVDDKRYFGGAYPFAYTPPNPNYYNVQGVSLQYFDNNEAAIATNNNILTPSEDRNNNTTENNQFDQTAINYSATGRTYNALRLAIVKQQNENQVGTSNVVFATSSLNTGVGTINNEYTVTTPIKFTPTGKSKYVDRKTGEKLDLKKFNIDYRLGLSQAEGYGDQNPNEGKDQINLTPLYLSSVPPGYAYIKIPGQSKATRVRDLIKFRIEAVDNDRPTGPSTWMIFRSYLKDIVDTPNPTWNPVNYVGRGETFYIYKGFERNISFTLQVAAMSEAELKPMWQKLNYLYSNTMPDYSNNVMRAPYMKLTLGNYMYRQPGIIKSLTYNITNDSPWEIAIDDPEGGFGDNLYELPHVMTIQMTFAPIHDFLPRKFPSTYNGGEDWKNLPAFTVDREDNQNKWLTEVFESGNIPFGNSEPNS
jgi:hypothetical protein